MKKMCFSILILAGLMFFRSAFASVHLSYKGQYEDKNLILKGGVYYSNWVVRPGGKAKGGSRNTLTFKWIPKNTTVKNVKITFKNKTYTLEAGNAKLEKNTLVIRLKKSEENYFFTLTYRIGQKQRVKKLVI